MRNVYRIESIHYIKILARYWLQVLKRQAGSWEAQSGNPKPGVKINIDFEGKKKKKRKLTGWDIAMNYACNNI